MKLLEQNGGEMSQHNGLRDDYLDKTLKETKV